jgi:hypothetical protein
VALSSKLQYHKKKRKKITYNHTPITWRSRLNGLWNSQECPKELETSQEGPVTLRETDTTFKNIYSSAGQDGTYLQS